MVNALGGAGTPSVEIMNLLPLKMARFARIPSLAQRHSNRSFPVIAIASGKGYAPLDQRLNGKSIGGLSCYAKMRWSGATGGGATLPWQASPRARERCCS